MVKGCNFKKNVLLYIIYFLLIERTPKTMANINYKAFEAELEKLLNTVPHLVTEDTVRYQFIKVHNKDVQIEIPYIRNKPPHTPIKVRAACSAYFKNSLSRADL